MENDQLAILLSLIGMVIIFIGVMAAPIALYGKFLIIGIICFIVGCIWFILEDPQKRY